MADISYLSQEGFDRLNAELDDLKSRGRQEAAKAIAEAREKGDLSENAEYHAAKDEQGHLERKINEREKALAHARVLDPSQLDLSTASVLTRVRIKNLKNNKEVTYQLVAESEADLKERKISVSSPIGEGLLGKKVGEVAEIQTPGGKIQFEVMHISL
ncbi:MAG: transcription elongation factor GreA [Bacteroidetes bacterium]|nr:MAG: transcription elongation factor GreA [Bacteroidota bacterium]